jgi:hypothetical protein
MLRTGNDYTGNHTAQSVVAYFKKTGKLLEVRDDKWSNGVRYREYGDLHYLLEDGRTLEEGYCGRRGDQRCWVDVENGVFYKTLCDACYEEHAITATKDNVYCKYM